MFVDDCIVKKEMETKWTITNEEMEILGYTCKKAELKTSFFDADRLMHQDVVVSAWFTEDIPYSYGPNYINGLPGIVLKYENVYYDYIASSVEFKEISVPILPKTISIFTPEEYREQWENGKDNFKN
jgi:GLPGLI family protein